MEYKLPPLPDHPEPRVMAWSELEKRAIQEYGEACAIAAIEAQGVPDEWQPTAENVNALPAPVRRYIHDLVSNADPAGTVRDLTIAQDTIRELEFSNRLLRDACNEVVGCFNAAEVEGLQEALANTTDEHLKDLVERRLMYALYACQSLASAPPAPQASVVQQEPVAWIRPSGKAMLEAGGYCTVYASEGMSNHSTPLYTHPAQQAKPKPITEQELKAGREAVTDDPDEQPDPWSFRMGAGFAERHHGIKE